MIQDIRRMTQFCFLMTFLVGFQARAELDFEIVQSVPLETTLEVPGVRLAQDVWLEMINSAQKTIDIEQFYVSDEVGQALSPVLQAIENASQRGVQVRLLVDKKFFGNYPESVKRLGSCAKCESRTIDFAQFGGVQHAKFFIVDGKQTFVGSQNFDWRALNQIHEIGVRVVDAKVIQDLQAIFEKDWNKGVVVKSTLRIMHSNQRQPENGPSVSALTLVASPTIANPKGILDSAQAITDLMKSAQQTLRIQVMEYSLDVFGQSAKWRMLDDAIRAAAQRGVQVQLLVDASKVEKNKADLKSLAQIKGVEVKSAKIPQFSGGEIPYARLIHSKYLVVDQMGVWVGTENWSKGYFMNTRDVGVVVRRPESAAQLAQVFDRIWSSEYVQFVR